MPRTLFAADLHLGQGKSADRRGFSGVGSHDATICSKWNDSVDPDDFVYIIGDVCLSKRSVNLLAGLNGTKVFVGGNNDKQPTSQYLQHCIRVSGVETWGGCVLTHIPIHTVELARWRANIHGHPHEGIVRLPNGQPDPRYICVSIDQHNLMPIPADALVLPQMSQREADEAAKRAELAELAAQNAPEHPSSAGIRTMAISKQNVREILLAGGFSIKDGQADLKDYVFESVRQVLMQAGVVVDW